MKRTNANRVSYTKATSVPGMARAFTFDDLRRRASGTAGYLTEVPREVYEMCEP